MSNLASRWAGALLCALLLLPITGCGGGIPPAEGFEPTGKHKMEEIGQMLRIRAEDKKRPLRSSDMDEIEPFLPLGGPELRRGDLVYIWGTGLATAPNAASTVIAYEKKAGTEGGWVLFQDGTVKQLTADEFKSAPKAR